jgi:multidrug efflux pump subunit AcrA (membrane-fusion protein)
VVAVVVAAAETPRLRPDLVVRRIPGEDGDAYVVKDPVRRKYFRFSEAAGRLLGHLDGNTSLPALQQKLRAAGTAPSIAALEGLVQQLHAMDLLELSAAERMEHQLDRLRTERRLRVRTRNAHGTLLHYRFSLWDPDQWMDRVVPRLGFLWSQAFFLLSLTAILVAAAIIAANWKQFGGELAVLLSGGAGISKYAGFLVISLIVIAIHELGHGLTCKKFGGHVHEIGFLLMYFTPCFYCNVNDAWLFERRSERLWVTIAGGYIELFVGALATFVWWLTAPGHPVNVLAFQTALVASVAAVGVNLNPLIKLDGYYGLSDYLGMPNLREHSFRYLLTQLHRLLGRPAAQPELSDRRRRILLTYGLLAGAYSGTILVLFVVRLFDTLVRKAGDWGVLGFLAIASGLILLPGLQKLRLFSQSRRSSLPAGPDPSAPGTPAAPRPAWILPVLLVIGLLTLPHWSMPARLRCVFEPGREAVLYAPEDARVDQVLCAEGQRVEAGQPVLKLQATGLTTELARAQLELLISQVRERQALQGLDLTGWRGEARKVAEQQTEVARLKKRQAWLTVSSPVAGVCLTARPGDLAGRAVTRGTPLLTIGDTSRLLAVIAMEPHQSWGVRPGSVVLLTPHALPGLTLRGQARDLIPEGDSSPAAESGAGGEASGPARPASGPATAPQSLQGSEGRGLRLTVPVLNPGPLRPGMTGSVKIYGPARSAVGHLWDALLRLARADLWG